MGRVSYLTPTYFFASVRKLAGKASSVANLSIFLNYSSNKVAIIDLDKDSPAKLVNAFPASVVLQQYSDISDLQAESGSRFKKAIYFSDTEKISIFPAQHLKSISDIFYDTSLRDFFNQVRATFDYLLINLPPGIEVFGNLSQILEDRFLWKNNQPQTIIVSQTDQNSLVDLDATLLKNPGLLYHLKESMLVCFNKVPRENEGRAINDSSLTASEVKSIFKFPHSFVIHTNEEFPHQRNTANPIVLDEGSYLRQVFSYLLRVLKQQIQSNEIEDSHHHEDFCPSLDGNLLNSLTPYIERLQKKIAARLFLPTSDIQVFLEENETNYRLRVRISGDSKPLLPIETKIDYDLAPNSVQLKSPENFNFPAIPRSLKKLSFSDYLKIASLSVKPLFSFDDRFAWKTGFGINENLDYFYYKTPFLSPLVFKQVLLLKEIPTLSHILGFLGKRFTALPYLEDESRTSSGGVTHFFIPSEFSVNTSNSCRFSASFSHTEEKVNREKMNELAYTMKPGLLLDRNFELSSKIPDLFSRNWFLEDSIPTHFPDTNTGFRSENIFSTKTIRIKGERLFALPIDHFVTRKIYGKSIESQIIPKTINIVNPVSSYFSQAPIPCPFPKVSRGLPEELQFIFEPANSSNSKVFSPNIDKKIEKPILRKLETSVLPDLSYENTDFTKDLSIDKELEEYSLNSLSTVSEKAFTPIISFINETDKYVTESEFIPQNRFKYDPLLLEQSFISYSFSEVPFETEISERKSALNTELNFNQKLYAKKKSLNFSFLYKQFVNPELSPFTLKVDHCFFSSTKSLKTIPYVKFPETKKFLQDILPCSIKLAEPWKYQKNPLVEYNSDRVLDSELQKKLNLSRKGFLNLASLSKKSPTSCQFSIETLKDENTYFKIGDFPTEEPISLQALVLPNQDRQANIKRIFDLFVSSEKASARGAVTIFDSDALLSNKSFSFGFDQDFLLRTLPARSLSFLYHFFNPSNEIVSVKESQNSIVANKAQIKFLANMGERMFEFSTSLEIPSKFPFRQKRMLMATIMSKLSFDEIMVPEYRINQACFDSFHSIKSKICPIEIIDSFLNSLPLRFPFLTANKTYEPTSGTGEIVFTVSPAPALEVFYEELRKQAKFYLGRSLYLKPLSSAKNAPDEISLEYLFSKTNSDQASNSPPEMFNTTRPFTPKMTKPVIDRNHFKIKKLKVRDLLRMAHETRERVKQVSSGIKK